jgi:hypothetical protein
MLVERVSELLRRRYREDRRQQDEHEREREAEEVAERHSRPDPVVVEHTVMNVRPLTRGWPRA